VVSIAPGQGSSPAITPLKFDHKAHAELETPVKVEACAQCHGSDKGGTLSNPASSGHQPCLAAGCHAQDFLSVGARTRKDEPERYAKAAGFCLGCHEDSLGQAPWPYAKAEANNLYRNNAKPGHFVEMNHLAHSKAATTKGSGCRSCHVVDAATYVLDVEGPGHSECATCHDGTTSMASFEKKSESKPVFAMGDCDGCHRDGDPSEYFKERRFTSDVRSCNSKRLAALDKKQKSKAPCFKHEREGHRERKSGEQVQCGQCHFMFSSKRYEGHGYVSLLDIKQAPLMDNSRDRAHQRCGTSGCHRSAVDESHGTGRCTMCHSSKLVLGSLLGGSTTPKTPSTPLVDDDGDKGDQPRKRHHKKPSLDDLVN